MVIDVPKDNANDHKRKRSGNDLDMALSTGGRLGNWIIQYFNDEKFRWKYSSETPSNNENNSSTTLRYLPPLYLQHSGHSRTVIGIYEVFFKKSIN